MKKKGNRKNANTLHIQPNEKLQTTLAATHTYLPHYILLNILLRSLSRFFIFLLTFFFSLLALYELLDNHIFDVVRWKPLTFISLLFFELLQ